MFFVETSCTVCLSLLPLCLNQSAGHTSWRTTHVSFVFRLSLLIRFSHSPIFTLFIENDVVTSWHDQNSYLLVIRRRVREGDKKVRKGKRQTSPDDVVIPMSAPSMSLCPEINALRQEGRACLRLQPMHTLSHRKAPVTPWWKPRSQIFRTPFLDSLLAFTRSFPNFRNCLILERKCRTS